MKKKEEKQKKRGKKGRKKAAENYILFLSILVLFSLMILFVPKGLFDFFDHKLLTQSIEAAACRNRVTTGRMSQANREDTIINAIEIAGGQMQTYMIEDEMELVERKPYATELSEQEAKTVAGAIGRMCGWTSGSGKDPVQPQCDLLSKAEETDKGVWRIVSSMGEDRTCICYIDAVTGVPVGIKLNCKAPTPKDAGELYQSVKAYMDSEFHLTFDEKPDNWKQYAEKAAKKMTKSGKRASIAMTGTVLEAYSADGWEFFVDTDQNTLRYQLI